jgi:hypothetical protein
MFHCDRYVQSVSCDNLVSYHLSCASSLCFVVSKKCPWLYQWSGGTCTCHALVLRLTRYIGVAHPRTMTIWTVFWTTLYESDENILKCVFLYLKSKFFCQQFPYIIVRNMKSISNSMFGCLHWSVGFSGFILQNYITDWFPQNG